MIAGTILYTSGNISNPIIRTAHAEWDSVSDDALRNGFAKIANAIDQISACRN